MIFYSSKLHYVCEDNIIIYHSLFGDFIMIRRFFKKVNRRPLKAGVDDLQQIHDEIESQQRKIAEEKQKIKEEQMDGSRLTKHRFTI